jgi:hypothetical protein
LGCSGIYGPPPEKESGRPKACQERPTKPESVTGETSVRLWREREVRGRRGFQRKKGDKKRKNRRSQRGRKMKMGTTIGGVKGTPSKKQIAKKKRQERERREREAAARVVQQEKVSEKAREKTKEKTQRKADLQQKEKEKKKEVDEKESKDDDDADVEVDVAMDEEVDADMNSNSGGSDSDLSEVDLDAVYTEDLVRQHNEFEEGRKGYMAWSTVEGEKLSMLGAKRIQSFFDKNKGEETFRDGFLVGAMFFHQSSPAVGDAQLALTKIGLESMITPITRTTTEPKNYEVRVWDKNNIESTYRIISKRGKELVFIIDKPFRWKDL